MIVINRSEATRMGSGITNPQPEPKMKPRTYDDGPLPIRASGHAPLDAVITNRKFEDGIVTFDLKIGNTDLRDVGLEEILDYVSPYHLEEFENAQFQQEAESLRIAEEEDRRLAEEQHEKRRQRAKMKGVVITQETSADEGGDVTGAENATGKHGRARPSYKPMFKEFKQRRHRRKRHPQTGELMPLSDGSEATEAVQKQESPSDDQSDKNSGKFSGKDPLSLENLPKRRRRKRDPITGELMPLSPPKSVVVSKEQEEASSDDGMPDELPQSLPTKRPRRRRHPITHELMPLGWRYDPEAERQQEREIRVPSIQRLSISKENEPKRRRLEHNTSPSGRSKSPTVAIRSGSKPKENTAHTLQAFKKGEVINLDDSGSEDWAEEEIAVTPAAPKPRLLRRSVGGASIGQDSDQRRQQERGTESASQSTGLATLPVRISPKKAAHTRVRSASSNLSIIPLQVEAEESASSEEEEEDDENKEESEENASTHKPSVPVTSILHPSALTDEASSSGDEDEDEDVPDDEYVVEKILSHAWSQPSTHPAHLGKKPVMLYQVKWEGWTDPTWEPRSSFADLTGLNEYQVKAGMKRNEIDG